MNEKENKLNHYQFKAIWMRFFFIFWDRKCTFYLENDVIVQTKAFHHPAFKSTKQKKLDTFSKNFEIFELYSFMH